MEGWISLHRKFTEWEWYDDNNMVKLFIHILIKANYKEKEWQGINIKRGQYLTGLDKLEKETSISKQTLRTCLKRLEKTKEINTQTTNRYRIITICNYDSYQVDENETNKQLTNKQQSTNKQLTATNKDNKDNNIIEREKHFHDEVLNFKTDFDHDLLKEFFGYWSEPNQQKTKMKFELEKTWDTKRRLNTWKRNKQKFK